MNMRCQYALQSVMSDPLGFVAIYIKTFNGTLGALGVIARSALAIEVWTAFVTPSVQSADVHPQAEALRLPNSPPDTEQA
ncbi:hypothetical protein V866_005518 [Kwoniella sp. B9012]